MMRPPVDPSLQDRRPIFPFTSAGMPGDTPAGRAPHAPAPDTPARRHSRAIDTSGLPRPSRHSFVLSLPLATRPRPRCSGRRPTPRRDASPPPPTDTAGHPIRYVALPHAPMPDRCPDTAEKRRDDPVCAVARRRGSTRTASDGTAAPAAAARPR
eukprot:ctg_3534.g598